MDLALKRILFTVLQLTWGALQTLAGLILFLVLIKRRHFIYRCCAATEWSRAQSLSLGLFIFISDRAHGDVRDELCAHEYGHCIQSLILGVLYFPVIALPSGLWCMHPRFEKKRRERNITYYSFFTERWANRIAERVTGKKLKILV